MRGNFPRFYVCCADDVPLMTAGGRADANQHMVNREITQRAQDERLEVIRAELLGRIRPVCRDMPDELFLEMIEAMAAIQLKYELRDGLAPK